MKIALLTHHWVHNFGANLQALGTFRFLESQGHEVIILNYRPKRKLEAARNIRENQREAHEEFCRTFFRQSPVLCNTDDLKAYIGRSKFDVIIAGSDSLIRLKKSIKTEEGKITGR